MSSPFQLVWRTSPIVTPTGLAPVRNITWQSTFVRTTTLSARVGNAKPVTATSSIFVHAASDDEELPPERPFT